MQKKISLPNWSFVRGKSGVKVEHVRTAPHLTTMK